MPDAFFQSSNHFEGLIDLLGKISQVLSTNGLDDLLFLISQRESLTEITVCEGLFRRPEQGLAKLIADDGRREQPMQSTPRHRRFIKAPRGSRIDVYSEHGHGFLLN